MDSSVIDVGRKRFCHGHLYSMPKYKYSSPSALVRVIRGESRFEEASPRRGVVRWAACPDCGYPKKVVKLDTHTYKKPKNRLENRKGGSFYDPDLYWNVQVLKTRQQGCTIQEIYNNWTRGARVNPSPPTKSRCVRPPHHLRHHAKVGDKGGPTKTVVRTKVACSKCFDPYSLDRLDVPPHKYDPDVMKWGEKSGLQTKGERKVDDHRIKLHSGEAAMNTCGSAKYLFRLLSRHTPSPSQ